MQQRLTYTATTGMQDIIFEKKTVIWNKYSKIIAMDEWEMGKILLSSDPEMLPKIVLNLFETRL